MEKVHAHAFWVHMWTEKKIVHEALQQQQAYKLSSSTLHSQSHPLLGQRTSMMTPQQYEAEACASSTNMHG
eukprot:1156043-Pelagomonas_calceolata.AAC.19